MPLYDFKCYKCDDVETYSCSVKEMEELKTKLKCDKCKSPMKKIISKMPFMKMVLTDDNDYLLEGKRFNTIREKKAHMKKNNLVELSNDEALANQKNARIANKAKNKHENDKSWKAANEMVYKKKRITA